jgi:hypothetical protein
LLCPTASATCPPSPYYVGDDGSFRLRYAATLFACCDAAMLRNSPLSDSFVLSELVHAKSN